MPEVPSAASRTPRTWCSSMWLRSKPSREPGHVQPPHPGRALADLGDRLGPVRVQVGGPGGQRLGVVLAQVLLVPHLEAGVVHVRDQVAGSLEFPVGEDVAVDEPARADGGLDVVRPGDAVVQQPPAGPQLPEQEREVGRQVRLADVLGQADRADRVQAGLRHVPVIQVPDLGEPGQARPLDRGLRPRGLLGGQRHAERPGAVLARRVQHHAAPAAADVEQPHAARAARACAQPGRTCWPAPLPGSRPRADSRRRCTPSTARAPTHRTGWTRRNDGRSRWRRGPWSAACRSASGAIA